MKKKIFSLVLGLVLAIMGGTSLSAAEVEVYFFYSKTCPHCHAQMPLMQAIDKNNSDVKVNFVEISANAEFWRSFLKEKGMRSSGVPRTFFGDVSFVGYSSTAVNLNFSSSLNGYIGNRVQIVKALEEELGHPVSLGDFDMAEEIPETTIYLFWPLLVPLIYTLSYLLLRKRLVVESRKRIWIGGLFGVSILALFFIIGTMPDSTIEAIADRLPYPLFVFVVALADGFNPCAFTVLIILLSLLTYTKSRKGMAILGGTFIFSSAVMYFIFIMLMIVIGGFFFAKYGKIITFVLGAAITGAGLLNVKDFFFLNKGLSLGISDKRKLQITKKASAIVKNLEKKGGTLYLAIGGTFMLGVFVNLVELGCTAILPIVYLTTLMSKYNSFVVYSAWTAFYAVVYILPLLAILANFLYFFKSIRISENQGRILKLVSGAFMLFFGLLMVFKPQLLMFG